MFLGLDNFDGNRKAQKKICVINFQRIQKYTKKDIDVKFIAYKGVKTIPDNIYT